MRSGLRLRRRVEALQFFDQRRALQVQQARGLALVALRALERAADQRELDRFDVTGKTRFFTMRTQFTL